MGFNGKDTSDKNAEYAGRQYHPKGRTVSPIDHWDFFAAYNESLLLWANNNCPQANWFAAKPRMCIWCISMYINIDMCIYIYIHIYIYMCMCVMYIQYTGTRLYYHPQNFTWLRLHKWKWSGIADLLRTYSKHVRQATLDSMWCMNMSTSKKNSVKHSTVRLRGTTMSLSWKHISYTGVTTQTSRCRQNG